MFSDENITKYQEIYRKRFGNEITREEATRQGTNLLDLLKIIYRPIPRKEEPKE